MIAFDTDVLTEILLDNPVFVDRAAAIPQHEQAVPIVVIEEILRGRLNVIRQVEANTARISVARAYDLFEQTIKDFQRLTILSYTPQADVLYRDWRQQRIRVPTHDLGPRLPSLPVIPPCDYRITRHKEGVGARSLFMRTLWFT